MATLLLNAPNVQESDPSEISGHAATLSFDAMKPEL